MNLYERWNETQKKMDNVKDEINVANNKLQSGIDEAQVKPEKYNIRSRYCG